ncbi:uncharacterized protein P174DRAFT_443171 [Aspergillus novofumigatus IBT 16806]|uniref:Uncharacterized protein n=1 Tax=Aspergillus novofumigatus (strain IBT 16806) TaxID=1392255 RepID=A0A2I1C6T2_ASPN1|nr:uncharacterized protein P174DRAFT_443171 [Aspergillus novofumigatus IBT 16806]PKX93291.1 hypothetical protein P174DRAFT_443171 [Aspergillus novofumigatus IBT 16806]
MDISQLRLMPSSIVILGCQQADERITVKETNNICLTFGLNYENEACESVASQPENRFRMEKRMEPAKLDGPFRSIWLWVCRTTSVSEDVGT